MIERYVAHGQLPPTLVFYRCATCGLEYADPTFMADASWYELVEHYTNRWEFNPCLRDLAARSAHVLEVGCGDGRFLARLAAEGHRAVGIDFNSRAVADAVRQGLAATTDSIAGVRDHQPGFFDAVVAFQTLEHFERPVAFLAELRGAVEVGGTVHLSFPSPRRYVTRYHSDERVGRREMWDYPPHHQTRWDRSAVNAALNRAGWRLTAFEEEPFRWPTVARFLSERNTARAGRSPDEIGLVARWAQRSSMLARTAPGIWRYKGWSAYVRAEAVR